MLAQGAGVIVNVASQLGQIGGIELVHYSAAKAAVIGMTKALAREVSRRAIIFVVRAIQVPSRRVPAAAIDGLRIVRHPIPAE